MYPRGFSLFKTIVGLFVTISLAVIALHTVFSWVPDTAQIQSASLEGEGESEVIDLKQRLKKALDESYEVTITEEELNAYIAQHLLLTQSAIVDDYVKFKGVYVDLQPNQLELTIEREIDYPRNLQEDGSKKVSFLPMTQTVSLQLAIEVKKAENGDVHTLVSFPGAKFGQSPAPGGLVAIVKPSFDVIAEFFEEEIKLAYNNKTSVEIEDGVIKIDPRPLGQRD